MTSSLCRKDSSSGKAGRAERTRPTGALGRVVFAVALVALVTLLDDPSKASAQTTPAPSTTPGAQPGQSQEPQTQPPQPTPTPAEQQQVPLQQYPIQQPGRPITPGAPPSTTLPPWTPPVPPPPSQTNIPAPLLVPAPGTPGAPGAYGYTGIPALTLPGAFAPTVVGVRGATLELHPTLRLGEEYSDNFFQTSSHAKDNFRSTFGPGFTLLLNGARTFGTLSTVVDLVHDTAPNSGDDVKVFPSLSLAVRYMLTPRLSLTFTDVFVRNDQAQTADQFGLRRGRQTFNSNTAGVAADWLLDQVATQAYYRNVLFFNESDGNNNTNGTTNANNQGDSITHILGVNAATRIATDYLVRVGYEFSRTDTTGGVSTGTDTTSHTVFGSASRQFGLFTTGGLSTSYQWQTTNSTSIWNASLFGAYGRPTGLSLSGAVGYSLLNSDIHDTEGTVSANATASYRFARATIAVGVFQDFVQTAQQGQNFGTVQTRSYFGSFVYQLTPFINASANVRYSENEPTGTGNEQNTGTQKTLTYGAGVNWQALRWLIVSLQYTYTKQTGQGVFGQPLTTTGFGGGDFAENRATLNLFATF